MGQCLPIGLQDGVIDDAEASIQEIIREPEVGGLGIGQFLEYRRARPAPQVEFKDRHSAQGQPPRRKAVPVAGLGVGTPTAARCSVTPRGWLRRASMSTRQTLRASAPQMRGNYFTVMPLLGLRLGMRSEHGRAVS